MKKLLYGSTALIAAGMVASSAGAAERIKMGITGYFQAFGIYVDQDDGVGEPGANRREHSLEREGEIIFNGKTTLDNGIEVGVQVQLEAETCGDQIDESFIWFEGGFGRINLGSENSAAYLMHYAAPVPSGGFAFGLNESNFRAYQPGGHFSGPGATTLTNPVLLSSDSEKITYFTPRIAGFQLGVSYTPDQCEENTGVSAPGAVGCGGSYGGTELDNNNTGEIFELGVNFVQKFGDFNVAVSGSWGTGDDEVGTAATDDPEQWSLGFQVSAWGFTVGGAYSDAENIAGARGVDTQDWNIGLRYVTGPWGVGIAYANKEAQRGVGLGDDEIDAFEIGGSYDLGPGVQLNAGVQFWDLDASGTGRTAAQVTAAENEATVIFIGTSISF
jgi:outer membrane protein OmpU